MIALAALLVLVGGPVLLGVAGLLRPTRARIEARTAMPRWDWRLTLLSTLLCGYSVN